MAGDSTEYYRTHPKARANKKKYDTAYESTPERKKYRRVLASTRYKRNLKGDPRDLSHKKNGTLVLENASKNRARNGANGKSTKK